MAQEASVTVFVIKTIARFAFAAIVLAAASAHAQIRNDAAATAHPQAGIYKAPSRGGHGSDYYWLQGSGG